MNTLQGVILGIVQGFAEFLPVSSSGHLVLAQKLFRISEPMLTFDICVHLGTLAAVFFVFWRDIFELLRRPFQKLTFLLIIATIPAVISGFLFKDAIESLFRQGLTLGLCFAFTGLLLLLADHVPAGQKSDSQITVPDALAIGLMQAIAIAPGISRSGSTITAALFRRLTRDTAAKFSFLMSIPVILGAAVLQGIELAKDSTAIASADVLPLALGFLAAMLSGYLSIRFMLTLIRSCKLRYFGFYVFVVAAFILVDTFVTKAFFA